ncbi:MAG TPA: DUF4142 domain-containing protein [Coxiellaceae bacterium]|nr:MAG: hypothetical protein A3E81_00790 [Gammaproteobacteria bacterium RIFCSPHIGHO2_12_FULL_36_30]HLB56696.1 DUF4142 domain-containing protein [Coxiellaceae bacterium]
MKKVILLAIGIVLATTTMAATTVAATKAAAPSTITKAEISTLATVAAIDKDEILLGVVALNKHAPSYINNFANMMISMHGENLTEIMQLAHQYHVSSLTNAMSNHFIAAGDKEVITMGGMNGEQFYKAYVNAAVTDHTGALHLIDTKLMQTATTPTIKKFMVATRAVVAMHLEHAKEMQKKIHA